MKAELGTNPSYTWRGIFEASGVLRAGLRRRIGNGLSTRVWSDPWLAGTKTHKVLSPRGEADESIVVADLLSADGRDWNVHKVRTLFLPFEQSYVLNTRINREDCEDDWVWNLEKDGTYYVKSAYRALVGDNVAEEGQSNVDRNMWVWKRIWKTDMRNKVVFEGTKVSVDKCVKRVSELLREMAGLREAVEEKRQGGEQEGVDKRGACVRWCKPVQGLMKINVDARVAERSGLGIGAVYRDEMGGIRWGWAERRRAEFEPSVAEAEAMLAGVRMARRMKMTDVCMETDCKDVIDAITSRRTGRSDFHSVISDILLASSHFRSVSWSFVRRNCNHVAHELAHFCPIGSSNLFDGTTLPRSIIDIANADLI
ncbi:uncharacterized protein LOC141648695 [Silene latifolia]|uniref:uncharacterized protein LOC141648695 n=1 Tax=Silene latifolia TaxID=37657 RepID=UPI003D76F189